MVTFSFSIIDRLFWKNLPYVQLMPKTLKLPCSKPRFDLTTRLLYLSLVILYFYFVFSLPRLALCLNVCMTYVGLETQGRS